MKVMDFLDCDVFFNFMEDKENGKLHLNAYHGVAPEIATTFEWLDFGGSWLCSTTGSKNLQYTKNHFHSRAHLYAHFKHTSNEFFLKKKL